MTKTVLYRCILKRPGLRSKFSPDLADVSVLCTKVLTLEFNSWFLTYHFLSLTGILTMTFLRISESTERCSVSYKVFSPRIHISKENSAGTPNLVILRTLSLERRFVFYQDSTFYFRFGQSSSVKFWELLDQNFFVGEDVPFFSRQTWWWRKRCTSSQIHRPTQR